MDNVGFRSPVKVCNLPLVPTIAEIVEKTLMLAIQADVVGGRKGFLWKAGDAIDYAVFVDMHPEVIPFSCLSSDDLHPLEQNTQGKLSRWNEHQTGHM